jgi:two-component system sensor histidine kinase KdpD
LSAASVLVILIVAAARYALGVTPGQLAFAASFFLVVVLTATSWGRGPAVVAGLSGALLFNYLIVPPPNAFSIPTADEGLFAVVLLASAVIIGTWKERTRRIERHVRELTASENLRKTVLDTIAHDFKTPLTAIVGSLSSLRSEGRWLSEGDRRELIETAYEEAARLTTSVDDVLEMTRLEARSVRLRREPTQVPNVIRQAQSQVRGAIGGRPFTVTISPDVPAISADGVLVSHAVANLLANAAKYSPPEAPIDVEAHAVDGHVVIAVSDRGIGVPEAETGRIFERFYRPIREGSIASATTGMGLGLAIAKGIVEAHGGRIWAHPRTDGGVVVKLRLPVGGL